MSLKNKIALVTGSSQGIGKSIALKLGEAEATLAIAALENEALEKAVDEFQSRGFRFKTYPVDLSIDSQIDSLALSVARDLGPVDILVNNAGIGGPTAPAHKVPVADWDKTLQINLRTPFLLSRAIIPSMIETQRRKDHQYVIDRGQDGIPLTNTVRFFEMGIDRPYADARAGTRSVQYSGQRNLSGSHTNRTDSVGNSGSAEATGTDFQTMSQEYVRATALKRMVLPEEVADLVLFLASPESAAITGQAIDISAGYGFRIGD